MARFLTFLRYVRAVLWSFVGLGGRSTDAATRLEHANPLSLIAIAFVVVLMLLGSLVAVARFAAGT